MPPKSQRKKGAGGDKSKAGEERQADPLQALVLTDSYENKFEPFTLERPRCLLPLANTPLLEYTLEFLAAANVEEVFLYCGNHTEQIEDYISKSKWTQPTAPFSLEIVRSQSKSIGDAMRDMDQKQLLVGDFICVYGDVISNIAISPALAEHKARRDKDKKAIMTMVLREADEAHRSKSQSSRPVFVVDPMKQRCLHYEQVRAGSHAKLSIDGEILADHPEIEIRADLIDCGIDICSQEVLSQYSDNFDWQLPRRGFLHGTLKDFELFQFTIHTHIATDGYAARVRSLQAYDAISRDVVARWTYPLCPDSNIVADQSFVLTKGNVYREKCVSLSRSAKVVRKVVLGADTSVGDNSIITNSIIGRGCVIGKRVKLDGAYLFDDVRIGDDTVIARSVVGNNVTLGSRCNIGEGSLLSHGVKIADSITLSPNSRISLHKRADNGTIKKLETDRKVVGTDGVGALLPLDVDDEDDPIEGLIVLPDATAAHEDDAESISTLNSELEEEEDEDLDDHQFRSTRLDSFGSIGSVGSDESSGARDRAVTFHRDAVDGIIESLEREDSADNIQLELKGLTLTNNVEGKQVRRAVAVALMKRIASLVESGLTPQKAVAQTIVPNKLLIERAVLDRDAKIKEEQVEFLLFMQTDLLHRVQGSKILLFACNALAQGALMDDEGFEQWLEDPRSSATEELKEIKAETEEIIGGDDDDDSEEEDSDDD